ncbi:MAG: hypothetical protein GYA31_00105 [Parcubacteria group bacterium]|nr:hypothetical protein [Parcubacteria group bacterium]
MGQNLLNLLPEELKNVANEFSDLILEKSLMRFYQNLSEENKTKMAQVFSEGVEQEKADFLNKYLGDLQKIMIEEAKKIIAETK